MGVYTHFCPERQFWRSVIAFNNTEYEQWLSYGRNGWQYNNTKHSSVKMI